MVNRNTKKTSKRVASIAGRVLKDKHYSAQIKSLAASALAQTKRVGSKSKK